MLMHSLRRMRIGRLLGVSAMVALILGSFLNPENTILDTLAFFTLAIVLMPIALELLWTQFRPAEASEAGDGSERAEAFATQLEEGKKALQAGDFVAAGACFEAAEALIGGQLSVALAEAEL